MQLELVRREEFRQRHGIHIVGSSTGDRFCSRIFCGKCGGKFIRRCWKGIREVFWKCENAEKKKGHTCTAANVKESAIRRAVVIAWNNLVENREDHLPKWERLAVEGDALARYRARMMIAMTAEGTLEEEVPELTRSVLEEIRVWSPSELEVAFLDGSRTKVRV